MHKHYYILCNIIDRPRASAAAERLWSNKKVLDEVAAAPRIEEQRCRMIRRVYDSRPVWVTIQWASTVLNP